MADHCTGETKSGAPCGAAVWRDGLCRWHHPDLEAQRAAARRAGGRAKSNAARARKQLRQSSLSHAELDGLLCNALLKVASGTMPPGVASALATLARAVIAVRDAGELAERVEALETAIDERKGA